MSTSGSSTVDMSSSVRAVRRKRPTSDVPAREEDETCFYHRENETTRCFRPRTCRQCLEKDGCMINQFGQCVDMAINGYNPWMDFHTAIALNLSGPGFSNPRVDDTLQQYHFPARTATYCSDHDPVCEQCRLYAFEKRDTRFCVGVDGCLCIAACELPTWESDIGGGVLCPDQSAPATLSSSSPVITAATGPESSNVHFKSASLYPSLYIAIAAFILCIATIILDRRRTLKLFRMYHTQGIVAMPSGNGQISIVAGTSRLNLFGWRDHLQELIDKEQLLLAGCEDLSPVSHAIDFFVDTPTAPLDVEFVEGTAPVATDAFVNASGPMLTPVLPSAPDFDDEIDDCGQENWTFGSYTML